MDTQGKIDALENIINNERGLIKWSAVAAGGLFASGLVASTVIYAISQREGAGDALAKYIMAIPPLAGTFLSSFPVKEYFAKKTRIATCRFVQKGIKTPPVSKKIEDRFWMIVDETIGRKTEKL